MKLLNALLMVFSLMLINATILFADDSDSQQKILDKLSQMENEISSLKQRLKEAKTVTYSNSFTGNDPNQLSNDELGQFGINYRSTGYNIDTMRLGAYGEVKYGRTQNGDDWSNGFDATRLVLLGTYQIAEDIVFNSELEFEHGGIARDDDDKLAGEVELEQIFVDFLFNEHFNWRSPGVDVVPIGYVGLFHEPTQYYSVNRPQLYNGLIPSTWFSGSTSVYGKINDYMSYQFQINGGLEDAATIAGSPGGSVPEDGYEAGISGTDALGHSRSTISSRKQLGNELGYAARIAYTPPVIPGLSGSSSMFYTSNTTPRGAYGVGSNPLGKSDLMLFDTEFRYRIPDTGLELRAEYVQVMFGNPENLRANNNGDATDNVGDSMYGYSFEAAYHTNLSASYEKPWELVPFYRYTRQNLQTSGFVGSDLNLSTGAGDQELHTLGLALFPTPKVVLKLDYQFALDDAPDSPNSDTLLGAMGFFF